MGSFRLIITLLTLLAAFVAYLFQGIASPYLYGAPAEQARCRCFPGDECWPSKAQWNDFNLTLQGKLIATNPIASVCHNSQFGAYDAEACNHLRSIWDLPETHHVTSSSPMAPFYANMSCDPYTPPDAQCVVGSYVQYAVNATSAGDYQLALKFAREQNIRFVIRNTGHDYLSKSTGAGALALWTHHIRHISVHDYSATYYDGKALKVGAGVMNSEAQAAAHEQGLVVVGGTCPSVGLAGGYAQGGGHGILASAYGLGADQVLEWEVVTSDGEQLTATPTSNSDLYWALSGGGGGTYAAVLSMTLRAYPEKRGAWASLTFSSGDTDAFYRIVQTFLLSLPRMIDAGVGNLWVLGDGFFQMAPSTAPGMTSDELRAFLQPTLDGLDRLEIPYGMSYNTYHYINRHELIISTTDFVLADYPSYHAGFEAMNPQYNITQFNIGGRFAPRSLIASEAAIAPFMETLKFMINHGSVVSGMSLNVSRPPVAPNAAHPGWRSAALVLVYGMYVAPP